jgi:hypothetical protein
MSIQSYGFARIGSNPVAVVYVIHYFCFAICSHLLMAIEDGRGIIPSSWLAQFGWPFFALEW